MFSNMWGIKFEDFGLHFDTDNGMTTLKILFESRPEGIPYGFLAERFKEDAYGSTLAAYRYQQLEKLGLEERLSRFYNALSDSVPNFGAMSYEQFCMVYRSYRSSYNGAARFKPKTFPGTIHFIKPADAQYRASYKVDVPSFWEAQAQNGICIVPVTGGNLSCLEEPHVPYTAQAISDVLRNSGY
jgi:hypothetical protein